MSIPRISTINKTLILKTGLLLFAVFLFTDVQAWAGINEWTSNGPKRGYVSSLAISPNYANDYTVFAGTEYPGGVFNYTFVPLCECNLVPDSTVIHRERTLGI